MNKIFQTNFFVKFKAPNFKEFSEKIESIEVENTPNFSWGEFCNVDKSSQRWQDWMDIICPSLDIFSKELNYRGDYIIRDPWINFYSKGSFQEPHDHLYCDIACVFFMNTGSDFSKFYFRDRYSNGISPSIREVLQYSDTYCPEISAGDIMFFPAHLLHGVSPHKSSTIRKTFSTNLDLRNWYKL